jgi:hypothetical protein
MQVQIAKNHFKILDLDILEDDATCFIGKQPYGANDLATLSLDMPCAISEVIFQALYYWQCGTA